MTEDISPHDPAHYGRLERYARNARQAQDGNVDPREVIRKSPADSAPSSHNGAKQNLQLQDPILWHGDNA